MDILVGIDFGTTNSKVVAFDPSGREVAQSACATPTLDDGDGRRSHDADAVWACIAGLVRAVIQQLPPDGRVAGVAVASVGEEIVPLDGAGRPLHPAIAWFDLRTESQATRFAARMDSAATFRISGLPVHPIWSAFKMHWVREAAPEAYQKAQLWLPMADYLAYRLCGETAASYSLASRTLLFDLRRRAWSPELMEAAEINPATLPEVHPSGSLLGHATAEAEKATGLPRGTPVAVGGHDHICGALAAGVREPGQIFDSAGTAEAILVALDEPVLDPALGDAGMTVGCHCAADRYYAIGAMPAGGVVDWFYRLYTGPQSMDREGALRAAQASPPGARGLVCLPYLMPGVQPGWGEAGLLYGLTTRHTGGDMVRAGLEGLTFEMRRLYDMVIRAFQVQADQIQFTGGMSRSRLVVEIKANVLGIPVVRLGHDELVAQGAAILAGLGAGLYRSEAEAVRSVYRTAEVVEPDPAAATAYRELYARYTQLVARAPLLTGSPSIQ